MQQVKTWEAPFLLSMLLACVLAFAGCSGAASPAGDSDSAAQPRLVVFGTQAQAVRGVVIENRLGAEIDSIALAVSDAQDEPYVLSGRTWVAGGNALVFVPGTNAEARSNLVVNAGKKEYVLHDIDLAAFDTAELCLKGKTAYLSYVVDGKTVSTLEHEKDLKTRAAAVKKAKEEAEAKAAAEAEAQRQAEEEAATQAAAEAEAAAQAEATWEEYPVDEGSYYEQPVYEEEPVYYEEPAFVEGGE